MAKIKPKHGTAKGVKHNLRSETGLNAGKTARVNMTLHENAIYVIDELARKKNVSRSWLISQAIEDYIYRETEIDDEVIVQSCLKALEIFHLGLLDNDLLPKKKKVSVRKKKRGGV